MNREYQKFVLEFYYRVFLCAAKSGYNPIGGRKHGYPWFTHFISGIIDKYPPEIRSWSGDENVAWKDLEYLLFPSQLKKIYIWNGENTTLTPILLLPVGHCLEVNGFSDVVTIYTKSNISIYLSDPYRQNFYR